MAKDVIIFKDIDASVKWWRLRKVWGSSKMSY